MTVRPVCHLSTQSHQLENLSIVTVICSITSTLSTHAPVNCKIYHDHLSCLHLSTQSCLNCKICPASAVDFTCLDRLLTVTRLSPVNPVLPTRNLSLDRHCWLFCSVTSTQLNLALSCDHLIVSCWLSPVYSCQPNLLVSCLSPVNPMLTASVEQHRSPRR